MFPQNTLSITEARAKIFDLAERAQCPGVYFTLTENGRAKVVVMSAEEFDSWRETLKVVKEFPNLSKDIAAARRDYKAGDYITLRELLANEGFVLADKSRKKYAIRSSHTKKGSKRSR